jgi:hypothetical protein
MDHRTPAYWPTRIMLAVGTAATVTVIAVALAMVLATPPMFVPMFGPEPTLLGLPMHFAFPALVVAVAVSGWVRMLHIFFRGRRGDEPPAWRYRDR